MQNDLERLLAQLNIWRTEPLEDEDGIIAEIDKSLRDYPIQFQSLDQFQELSRGHSIA